MQPEPIRTKFQPFTSFSIHKRIEGGATDFSNVEDVGKYIPFSIHKRIEGGATPLRGRFARSCVAFQYPQADRRGCNPRHPYSAILEIALSVSTSGSKGVQLNNCIPRPTILSTLSVSTSGSKGVQPTTSSNRPLPVSSFQYPQADRRGCNRIGAVRHTE